MTMRLRLRMRTATHSVHHHPRHVHSDAFVISPTTTNIQQYCNHNHYYLHLLRSCKHLNPLLQIHARLIVSEQCTLAQSTPISITNPSLILWNSLIRAYSRLRLFQEAIKLYHRMLCVGLEPDKYTFTFVLKACTGALKFREGVAIHQDITSRELECDVFIGTGLVDMYCKMGHLDSARKVFDKMPMKDVASWNTMISGYSQSSNPCEAMEIFRRMQKEGVEPDSVSILNLAPAVSKLEDVGSCKSINCYVVRRGLFGVVSNSLIDMYSKCGEVNLARRIFDEMQVKDDVSWATMMAGYVHHGCFFEVLQLLDKMKQQRIKMNKVSVVNSLLAAAEMRDLEKGRDVHHYALHEGIMSDIVVATPIVSMYAKCGELKKAKELFLSLKGRDLVAWSAFLSALVQAGFPGEALSIFQEMWHEGLKPDKTILKILVSWNVMIAGYLHNGGANEAISTFNQMKLESVRPNLVTFVIILPAVTYLSMVREAMAFHACIVRMGFISSTLVGNSLIDMYAKCGQLSYSEKCFHEMENKGTNSWNAMLSGYAMHGQGELALALFSLMQENHVHVDSLSYISVLSACRHAGLIPEGKNIFHAMTEKHNLQPNMEHYACMVDLLGRAGLFDEVLSLIDRMPTEPDAQVWGALLGACKMHSNVKLGEVALHHLHKLEPRNAVHFVVLSDIYAQCGRWIDARRTRANMIDHGLKKKPGYSWVGAHKQGPSISQTSIIACK